jgi:hypothetical protein
MRRFRCFSKVTRNDTASGETQAIAYTINRRNDEDGMREIEGEVSETGGENKKEAG